eukprot:COSAG01_NODE_876_length_12963_cov_5.315454_2_plen_349_part_00
MPGQGSHLGASPCINIAGIDGKRRCNSCPEGWITVNETKCVLKPVPAGRAANVQPVGTVSFDPGADTLKLATVGTPERAAFIANVSTQVCSSLGLSDCANSLDFRLPCVCTTDSTQACCSIQPDLDVSRRRLGAARRRLASEMSLQVVFTNPLTQSTAFSSMGSQLKNANSTLMQSVPALSQNQDLKYSIACPKYTTPSIDNTECEFCPRGKTSDAGDRQCRLCPAGRQDPCPDGRCMGTCNHVSAACPCSHLATRAVLTRPLCTPPRARVDLHVPRALGLQCKPGYFSIFKLSEDEPCTECKTYKLPQRLDSLDVKPPNMESHDTCPGGEPGECRRQPCFYEHPLAV